MNLKKQIKGTGKFDSLKWVLIFTLLVLAIVANVYFYHFSLYLRLLAGIIFAIVILFLALQTVKGQLLWQYAKQAQNEIRRVVWPTKQATLQMAFVVLMMVVVVAIAIFIFDDFFLWCVAWLTGQRG